VITHSEDEQTNCVLELDCCTITWGKVVEVSVWIEEGSGFIGRNKHDTEVSRHQQNGKKVRE
jgi:hypothetical protein